MFILDSVTKHLSLTFKSRKCGNCKLGDNRSLVWCLKDISAVMDFCYFEQRCFKTKGDQMRSMILKPFFIMTIYVFDHRLE